ncbi:hypothetical protein [Streptomyces xanthochromogenes]
MIAAAGICGGMLGRPFADEYRSANIADGQIGFDEFVKLMS